MIISANIESTPLSVRLKELSKASKALSCRNPDEAHEILSRGKPTASTLQSSHDYSSLCWESLFIMLGIRTCDDEE
ncbi:hypothetical protein TorRG33x02_013900 [Trema orientale]|uniref:Uncharacterized protein n=1 Tax=Trema orientale TaxID=63057 RepID=A0A2P5FX82_TREOI|nr:hypothetical protein TorRG33x02_013900 [Trema orientale]